MFTFQTTAIIRFLIKAESFKAENNSANHYTQPMIEAWDVAKEMLADTSAMTVKEISQEMVADINVLAYLTDQSKHPALHLDVLYNHQQ